MGILEDHNAFHGAFRRAEREPRQVVNEHPKVWAVGAVVLSLLWLFGFGSVMGAGAGAYVLTGEGPPAAKRVAAVAVALGAVGLGIALFIAIRLLA